MTSPIIIRGKFAFTSPEGSSAIRLIGLHPEDDEKLKQAIEERFDSSQAYRSILKGNKSFADEGSSKTILRILFTNMPTFEYRRYPERPSWLDIVPRNIPPSLIREYVPDYWYRELTMILRDLGYAA